MAMVDFSQLLKQKQGARSQNPVEIFDRLDKTAGMGELRSSQKAVLLEWFNEKRNHRDVVVKLHTGQGKTLVGLLALASSMQEVGGPALYLCPDKFLVEQTMAQAESVGLPVVGALPDSPSPPVEFLNGRAIFVATYDKLFNGLSVFGVEGVDDKFTDVGAIVFDDAHQGVQRIREAFTIRIRKTDPEGSTRAYSQIIALFRDSLRRQGSGTMADIEGGVSRLLCVPYWIWLERVDEVIKILSEHRESIPQIKFPWNLVKNHLRECVCIVSGQEIEISPRLTPVEMVPSFDRARRRFYLSATLTEDSYLVRDLGVASDAVAHPVSRGDVPYSGERMILVPSLLNPDIRRDHVISWSVRHAKRFPGYGLVCLVPDTARSTDWLNAGARVASRETIVEDVTTLQTDVAAKKAYYPLVLNNRYDGVDLPDRTCRILVLDSVPGYSTLYDRYRAMVQVSGRNALRQVAQRIEQGMGRGIRGSSDYCAVVITGDNLTEFLTVATKRIFFSNEVRRQIETGEEISVLMKLEGTGMETVEKTIHKMLERDEGWRDYYRQTMEPVRPTPPDSDDLRLAELERKAELEVRGDRPDEAAETIQSILELVPGADVGWYLQLKATYLFGRDITASSDCQLKAYQANNRVLKPESGLIYSKLLTDSNRRLRSVHEFIRTHRSWADLVVAVRGSLDKLTFGVDSNLFEDGVDDLGRMLGYATSRPDRDLGQGPDNLWCLPGGEFWVIECKNQLDLNTPVIGRTHTEQLDNSVAWLKSREHEPRTTAVMVHPTSVLEQGAFPREEQWILTPPKLALLKSKVEAFFQTFKARNLGEATVQEVQERVRKFELEPELLRRDFLTKATSSRGRH